MTERRLLYSRNKMSSADEEADSDNPWDDVVLRQAYDKAFKLAKANLEKNTQNSNPPMQNAQPAKTDKMSEPKLKIKEHPAASSDQVTWSVGSRCRATWSQDGVEYEADIVSINSAKHLAKVRFVGYNNEDTLSLSSLRPSKGITARQLQIEQSVMDEENDSYENSCPPQMVPHENYNMTQAEEAIMFPPPPPPHVISYLPKDEQEALSAMLMSWYMSGYHTGYYQGLIAGRSSSKKKQGK